MRKVFLITATIFWLVMMGLLVRRQMSVSAGESLYKEFVRSGLSDKEVVMDIYWSGKKVGESRTSHSPTTTGGTINNDTVLSGEATAIGDVSISTMAQVDNQFRLEQVIVNVTSGKGRISAMGTVEGDELHVRITGLGENKTFRIPNPSAMAFVSGPFPTVAAKDLHPGKEWYSPVFDFASMKVEAGHAKVVSEQKILWDGKLRDTYKIVVSDKLGRKVHTAWSDTKGGILKIEFAGVTLVRRPDED